MSARSRQPEPVAPVDRRGALRHPVEVVGVLSTPTVPQLTVVLTDISEQGCQIVRPPELAGGEAIALSFAGFAPFDATVVWTSAAAAGLRFDYPAHKALIAQVVAAAKGRRRARRPLAPELVRREERERLWHLRLPVRIAIGDQEGPAGIVGVLSDLSTQGCRIVAEATPLPDAAIRIELEGHAPIRAQVRWCVNAAVGVQFAEPLAPEIIADLAERARALAGSDGGRTPL